MCIKAACTIWAKFQQAIKDKIQNITQELLCYVFVNMKRLMMCLQADGKHFEQFL